MNIEHWKDEHRTSNVQLRILNEKRRKQENWFRFSLRVLKRPFDHLDKLGISNRLTALSGVEGPKRNRNSQSGFEIGFFKTNEIKLRSAATSLFDVQRWTFDVGCSSFKPTPYGINATYEYLQNNLVLIGVSPRSGLERGFTVWSRAKLAARSFGGF